jgi:hypothetical protein
MSVWYIQVNLLPYLTLYLKQHAEMGRAEQVNGPVSIADGGAYQFAQAPRILRVCCSLGRRV